MAYENKLYRSTSDRMGFGVSGGMGKYFNLDPTLVRIGWVVLCFMTAGAAALLYIVMAIVVPEEASTTTSAADDDSGTGGPAVQTRRRNGFAWLLILSGFVLFAANNGFLSAIPWPVLAPIALIGLGLAMLMKRR
ncbi:MAG: PspC domain-containing protein [Dehalococcoidia bacterium]